MQMPLWVSREEEIKEGFWNWLEQVVLESEEETACKSCGPWQEPPFRARECPGHSYLQDSSRESTVGVLLAVTVSALSLLRVVSRERGSRVLSPEIICQNLMCGFLSLLTFGVSSRSLNQ